MAASDSVVQSIRELHVATACSIAYTHGVAREQQMCSQVAWSPKSELEVSPVAGPAVRL